MSPWNDLLQSPVDAIGLALYVLVFPVYHSLYPLVARRSPHGTAKGRMDIMRRSWIEGLIERREIVAAAQQTRNLTMMNSLLGSAALILLGMTANILLTYPKVSTQIAHPESWDLHPGAVSVKLYLLILVFAMAFSYYMSALRRLGQFNLFRIVVCLHSVCDQIGKVNTTSCGIVVRPTIVRSVGRSRDLLKDINNSSWLLALQGGSTPMF